MGILDRLAARVLLLGQGEQTPDGNGEVGPVADVVDDPNVLAQGSRGILGDLLYSTSALFNAVTGVGTARDPASYNEWAVARPLRRSELHGLGRNGLSYQALSKLPTTAMREGWRVNITDPAVDDKGPVSDTIAAYEERLALAMHCARAMTRGRQYGEAMVVLGIDDGRAMHEPVDVDNIRSIPWAAPIDVRYYEPDELYQADTRNFTKVKTFRITDINGFLEDGLRYGPNSVSFTTTTLPWEGYATSGGLVVHRDRVMHFPTVDYLPLLETLQDSLGAFFESMHGIRTAARESSLVVYKISKWLRKSWSENSGLARMHMQMVDRAKSSMNAFIADKEHEEVDMKSRSLGGLADLANPFMVWLSAALATPVTVLWGVSPGGFGKGEAERETWHEEVRAYFAWAAKPEIHRVAGYILAAEDGCRLPFDTQREIKINDLSPPDEEVRSRLRSEALSDLRQLVKDDIITRAEARPAVAALNDDYFRPEVNLDAQDDAKLAQVGVFTASIQLMQALYPEGIPVDAGRNLMLALASTFFTEENVPEIFPERGGAASGVVVGEDPAPDADDESEGADAPTDEPSETALAWSENPLPADAVEAAVLAKELDIPTVRITRAHKAGIIEGWTILGGKPRYSREEVQRAVLRSNGKLPAPEPEVTDVRDGIDDEAYTCGVMLRVPDDIARWVPFKAGEPSVPHVTLLYVGKVPPRCVRAFVDAVDRVLANVPALRIDFDGVGYFDKDDERVAFARVVPTPELAALHDALRQAADECGLSPKHHDGDYVPHLTLAYLAPGDEYDGPMPPRGWTAREAEVWYDTVAVPVLCAEQLVSDESDTAEDSATAGGFFQAGSDPKVYSKPRLRNRLRAKILREGRGGDPGEWSARKAQLLALEYKRAGGGYRDGCEGYEVEDMLAARAYVESEDATEAQRSLRKWTQEEWMTCLPSGPSEEKAGSERRYLPKRACENLSPAQRRATNRKKTEGAKKGEQFVANTKQARKARRRATDETEPGTLDVAALFEDLAFLRAYDECDVFDEAAWEAAVRDRSDEKRQERIDEAFAAYHEAVNMGASELEEWAETEWSKKASVSREPIARNLRLLRKRKDDWTLADAKAAMRTVSFVARMKGNERGEPVKIDGREGPSKRDISLKNWAFDPNK